jgi:hypothetical protein
VEPREPGQLVVFSAPHPSAAVDRFGFPLGHPYVEQCLLPVLGPSSTVVLHRVSSLWRVAHPFETTFEDFGRALGLRPRHLSETFDRLAKFGFANRPAHGELGVYTRCAPLTSRLQARLPEWLQDTHRRLLEEHLARRVEDLGPAHEPVGPRVATSGLEGGQVASSASTSHDLRQKPPRDLGR